MGAGGGAGVAGGEGWADLPAARAGRPPPLPRTVRQPRVRQAVVPSDPCSARPPADG